MTPRSNSLFFINAIETEKKGLLFEKFVVPSNESTIQVYSLFLSIKPLSSVNMLCFGYLLLISLIINASLTLSYFVVISFARPLFSARFLCFLKFSRRYAPAFFAVLIANCFIFLFIFYFYLFVSLFYFIYYCYFIYYFIFLIIT